MEESMTFRFTVQNIRDLKDPLLSPPSYLHNLPWKIMAMTRRGPPPDRLQQKYLAFFLQCNGEDESRTWTCYAKVELRLISHKPGIEYFSRKVDHLYYSKENDWGYAHFLLWDNVLDPEQGYVKDNTITLEVHITAHEPHGISEDSNTGTVEGEEQSRDFNTNGFRNEEDEGRRSQATFRYVVPNISRMINDSSPPCYIRNLPWKIMVRPRRAPQPQPSVPGRRQQKYLGFFLQCNEKSESPTWSCYAKAELRLISHKPNTGPLTRKIKHLFHMKNSDYGFINFISFADLMDPEKGYVRDDTITLEVYVNAHEAHGISEESMNHPDAVGE